MWRLTRAYTRGASGSSWVRERIPIPGAGAMLAALSPQESRVSRDWHTGAARYDTTAKEYASLKKTPLFRVFGPLGQQQAKNN